MKSKKHLLNFISIFGLLLFLVLAFGSDDTDSNSENHEIVYNSSWDSSVRQVENFLENNLKDPDSFEAIEWSAVKKFKDSSFMVRCKYRAKNSFGGFVIQNQVFFLDSTGYVTKYIDYNKFAN